MTCELENDPVMVKAGRRIFLTRTGGFYTAYCEFPDGRRGLYHPLIKDQERCQELYSQHEREWVQKQRGGKHAVDKKGR